MNLINTHIWIITYVSSSGSLALCLCESLNLKPVIMALLMKTSSKLILPALSVLSDSRPQLQKKVQRGCFFSMVTKLQSSHGAAQLSASCHRSNVISCCSWF